MKCESGLTYTQATMIIFLTELFALSKRTGRASHERFCERFAERMAEELDRKEAGE